MHRIIGPRAQHQPSYNNNEGRRFQPYQLTRRAHFLQRGRNQGMKQKKEIQTHKYLYKGKPP